MPLKDNPSEIEIVTLFRARCKIQCPGVALVAVPNAAKRGQWAINQAMREGMAIGFPDMICLFDGGRAAFIEWKAWGGKASANQLDWIERLKRKGFPAIIARSADEGLDFLRSIGAPFLEVAA